MQLLDIYRLVEGEFNPTSVFADMVRGIISFSSPVFTIGLSNWVAISSRTNSRPLLYDQKYKSGQIKDSAWLVFPFVKDNAIHAFSCLMICLVQVVTWIPVLCVWSMVWWGCRHPKCYPWYVALMEWLSAHGSPISSLHRF